eukprot:tig00000704_g3307.t1
MAPGLVLDRFTEFESLAGAQALLAELERSAELDAQASRLAQRLAALDGSDARIRAAASSVVQACANVQWRQAEAKRAQEAEALLSRAQELRQCLAFLTSLKAGRDLIDAASSASGPGSTLDLVAAGSSLTALHAHVGEDRAPPRIRSLLRQNLDSARQSIGDGLMGALREKLAALGWPKVPDPATLPDARLREFESHFAGVLCISELEPAGHARASAVFRLLAEPFVVRFKFHFSEGRATNRAGKAEWYMAFVLQAIKESAKFLGACVQPVLDRHGLARCDAKVEFATQIVPLVSEKWLSEWPQVATADRAVLDSVDDLFSFEAQLRGLLARDGDGPGAAGLPSALEGVLGDAARGPQVLSAWLRVERDYAADAFAAAAGAENAWLAPPGAVSPAAEAFLSTLGGFAERFKWARQEAVRDRLCGEAVAPFVEGCVGQARQHIAAHRGARGAQGAAQHLSAVAALEAMAQALRDWRDDLALSTEAQAEGALQRLDGVLDDLKELLALSLAEAADDLSASVDAALASLFDRGRTDELAEAAAALGERLGLAGRLLSRPSGRRLAGRSFRALLESLGEALEKRPVAAIKARAEALQALAAQLAAAFAGLERPRLQLLDSFCESLAVLSQLEAAGEAAGAAGGTAGSSAAAALRAVPLAALSSLRSRVSLATVRRFLKR